MFAENLKERRESLGITMTALAQATGVSQAFITYLEKGYKQPSVELLKRIAKELRCTTDSLLKYKEE